MVWGSPKSPSSCAGGDWLQGDPAQQSRRRTAASREATSWPRPTGLGSSTARPTTTGGHLRQPEPVGWLRTLDGMRRRSYPLRGVLTSAECSNPVFRQRGNTGPVGPTDRRRNYYMCRKDADGCGDDRRREGPRRRPAAAHLGRWSCRFTSQQNSSSKKERWQKSTITPTAAPSNLCNVMDNKRSSPRTEPHSRSE
jgi:hypothetical protein